MIRVILRTHRKYQSSGLSTVDIDAPKLEAALTDDFDATELVGVELLPEEDPDEGGLWQRQIRIPLGGKISEAGEEAIMNRLTGFVSGGRLTVADEMPDHDPPCWLLGTPHQCSWIARIVDKMLEVTYCYSGARNAEMMAALKIFLTWMMKQEEDGCYGSIWEDIVPEETP